MSSHQPPSSQSTKPKSGREKESRPCCPTRSPKIQEGPIPTRYCPTHLILWFRLEVSRREERNINTRTQGRHPRSIDVEISHRLSCHFYFLVRISPGAPESSLLVALGLLSSGPILGTPTEAILPPRVSGPMLSTTTLYGPQLLCPNGSFLSSMLFKPTLNLTHSHRARENDP